MFPKGAANYANKMIASSENEQPLQECEAARTDEGYAGLIIAELQRRSEDASFVLEYGTSRLLMQFHETDTQHITICTHDRTEGVEWQWLISVSGSDIHPDIAGPQDFQLSRDADQPHVARLTYTHDMGGASEVGTDEGSQLLELLRDMRPAQLSSAAVHLVDVVSLARGLSK